MDRYIGLDVHATTCTAAVIDAQRKKLRSYVIETNGQALVEFVKMQPGTLHVCLEEGTQSGWLSEILSPHSTGSARSALPAGKRYYEASRALALFMGFGGTTLSRAPRASMSGRKSARSVFPVFRGRGI
jgi:hypothetical protein